MVFAAKLAARPAGTAVLWSLIGLFLGVATERFSKEIYTA